MDRASGSAVMKAKRIAAVTVLALWLSGLAAPAADAQGARIGDRVITRAWIRPTPEGAPTAAAYLTIAKCDGTPDRLMGGSTPEVAAP